MDGRYSLSIPSGAQSRLSAIFTGFVSAERTLTLDGPSCDQTLDLELALEPRTAARTPEAPASPARTPLQTSPRFQTLNVQSNDAGAGFGGPGGGRGGPGGRGGVLLGGRGARGQQPYQGSVTYTFGGSALDAAPD